MRYLSQAELIQRALDNEEGNIKEHKNYLKVEEEKRRKARTIKMPTVEGPLLRWTSKVEEENFKVNVEVTPPQSPAPAAPSYTNHYEYYTNQLRQYLAAQSTSSAATTTQAGSTSQPSTTTSTSNLITVATAPAAVSPIPPTANPSPTAAQTAAAFSTFRLPTNQAVYPFTYYAPTSTSSTSGANSSFLPSFLTPTTTQTSPQPVQKQYVEEERTEKVTKNYVIHELDQHDAVAKPLWKDTMSAMFGDHVKWEELKVFSGKGRPLSKSLRATSVS